MRYVGYRIQKERREIQSDEGGYQSPKGSAVQYQEISVNERTVGYLQAVVDRNTKVVEDPRKSTIEVKESFTYCGSLIDEQCNASFIF